MRPLLEHRLIVVTGKGGVGRTTCTVALGVAAARRGKRVCLVELTGQDAVARSVGYDHGAYEPRTVTPGVDVRSLSVSACLADFGHRKLRLPGLARWFFESRLMTGFVEAVPGLHDLVQLGKVENMLLEPLPGEPVYDMIVLDAPATGHGLTLLAAARSMREMTGVGPFHDLAAIIERLLGDPKLSAVAMVTLPEALPVNESLQLVEALREDGTPPSVVLVNQVSPPWPEAPAADTLLEALDPAHAPEPSAARARAVLREVATSALRRRAREAAARADLAQRLPLAAGRDVQIVELPLLDDPWARERLVVALGEELP